MIPMPSPVHRWRTMPSSMTEEKECKGPSRVPLTSTRPSPLASLRGKTRSADAEAVRFCLHPKRICSPAGAVCTSCGEVVAPVNEMIDSRSNVAVTTTAAAVPLPVDEVTGCIGAWEEWHQQTNEVVLEQPAEILRKARELFSLVYTKHGTVAGQKARALVLVCMLYELRRTSEGQDIASEEACLIRSLAVPTRSMNKAFTSLVGFLRKS